MIRVWIADVTPLYEKKCYSRYYEGLPSFRKEKADALKYLSRREQSVGVWALWEKMRHTYDLEENVSFNLSHSGSWVMCAAQTEGEGARVGCDIEKIGQLRINVAERRFCREEYEEIEEFVYALDIKNGYMQDLGEHEEEFVPKWED